ncbi:MAG: SDR family NAD(P)-dependent oxidoreductase [Alphaproteobacteria bacterium]|nr:SDR family NAD(P)-dependent oxidoreductase [Alphaproteobacteria bacterium]
MSDKACSLDASVLRISDGAPVKVTFLNAGNSGHFVGFYSMTDGVFQDVKALFAHVGADVLIPGVSSVFLGSRLNDKTPVFFVMENGHILNRDEAWFREAATGHGGSWKFLKPASQKDAIPALHQGKIIWRKQNGEAIEDAQDADLNTKCPVLVWQSNDAQVYVAKGRIFHSQGYGSHAQLNPDQQHRFCVVPQEDGSSVELDFIDVPSQTKELSFNLQIGERNFKALICNRIVSALTLPKIETAISSVVIEIPDEFEDTLYIEGYEDQKKLTDAGVSFVTEGSGTNRLVITGEADSGVYEGLLSRVKIKTAASAAAKCDVRVIFKTEKEEYAVTGQADIFSEKAQGEDVPAGLTLPKTFPSEKELPPRGIADILPLPKGSTDDLPSFLTQPVAVPSAVKKPNGKTVLITGGACKRGSAVAHAFAACGYNVIIHCNTAVAQATHLVEDLQQKYGVKASYFRADFNSYEETADLIPSVTKTYGVIDVLVCHAFAFVKDESEQGWNENMAVNLRAPFLLTRLFALSLPKGKEGTVVSVFAQAPQELSSYALSCSSLSGLTALAAEAYKNKIRINGLAVAGTPTDDSQFRKIAETTCFLAENPLVSGQVLKIDMGGSSEKKTSLF